MMMAKSSVIRQLSRSPRILYHVDRLRKHGSTSWLDVVEWVERNQLTAVGFDVYDTLLTRELNEEAAFWAVLAERLVSSGAWSGTAEQYLAARSIAATAIPGQNIQAWYEHPALAARASVDCCIGAELAFEAEITHSVPGSADALDMVRRAGASIAFVSDMHLPADYIKTQLGDLDLHRHGESVLVSGTVGVWKSSGELFTKWLDYEELPPDKVGYVGNHAFTDCAVPASLGLKVKPRRNGNPLSFERLMGSGGVAGAAVAAASTRARLAAEADDAETLTRIGTGVVGQTMMSFLLAIRARCQVGGFRQVAFVARDGELLLRMAGEMPKDYWSGVDLHYLHANRLTWSLAGAHCVGVDRWIELGTADQHSLLRHGVDQLPASSLLTRVGMIVDDLANLNFVGTVDPDRPLPQGGPSWLRILSNDSVRATIAERAAERYELIGDYLRGLGLRQEPALVVDVGWRGQTAALTANLLTDVLGHEPTNYHFGGYGVQPDLDANCRLERYAFDDSVDPVPFHSVDQLVEMFTGAGQRRIVGYERRDGAVVPMFDDGVEAMNSPDREAIWAAAMELAAMMPDAEDLDRWTTAVPDPSAVVAILKEFWTAPTRAEAMVATRLRLELDDAGLLTCPMAAPYRFSEIYSRPALAAPIRRWPEGSAAASSLPFRLVSQLRRRLSSGA